MSVTSPPILSVVPSLALVDEAFDVKVKNLPAGLPVTLHSLHRSESKNDWEAYGHYVSDQTGAVSVPDDRSFGGTYTGKEPMGLLWSMRPVPGSREGLRLKVTNVCSPMLIIISVYRGHVVEGFRDWNPLVSVVTERWYMAPGVQRIEVKENGLLGTLFIPPGPGPFPGLLDLSGGGGVLVEYRAALLASHGFVTLALDYFTSSVLTKLPDVEFSYLESAFNLIQLHPQVIPDRVGVFGFCLGAQMTLNLAAMSAIANPRCCVCVSGCHLNCYGKSHTTMYECMFIHSDKKRENEQNQHILRDTGLLLLADPENKVDVGRIKCPVMLINGDDDQNWPAVEYSEDMAQLMRAAGNDHLLTVLNYPDTGHLIGPPYSPHFRATNFRSDQEKSIVLWGGRTRPHSDAQEDSWRKILAFLEELLYDGPSVKARL
ncbi:peroxisomal succinyl-coenzyme A thioesterase-like [Thalassophryne amazonica]|uniref:peroxisomal succinyl-coenzyme A thioesterase-like n=1 Tax=Thalassophryne amazonica TaxID=390379 RepID=UPI001471ED9F|nr:peroxisomal succinyl-coenzyme A thioesterase-like [Thalassophryne amazonica]